MFVCIFEKKNERRQILVCRSNNVLKVVVNNIYIFLMKNLN